ncbi:hypothetical protein COU78_04120 [Candidatus Peregrinibacteria bacterium CG10_big_fil_rev_8_21_14_0_10_49_24]|nr:MAG: hypothetical protein COV83_00650 [Candidatus Peregrinibacteria bacterium CG11_big_fil_rev_8_21_14_0_20_49_14]PIR50855.1 MAG: hypothetical protein COU78_04120 [Candidatus Peregrinibacteria bacterium CG10_big_fil_rev_8_21_14_0_10_49_24]PJA67132.1 MAG: hypothetical protein CO157_06050 [Candidatus Peregrinibacteria bacterium CG_4_9_14_3_um_filter_49_12]
MSPDTNANESFVPLPENENGIIDDFLDIAEERLDMLDSLVSQNNIFESNDVLVTRLPTPEELRQRTQDTLSQHPDIADQLQQRLTAEEFATLEVQGEESPVQLDILPPQHDGSIRISFLQNGELVTIEEGWTFREGPDAPPLPDMGSNIVLESTTNGAPDVAAAQAEFARYISDGKRIAQHEALVRALRRIERVQPDAAADVSNPNNDPDANTPLTTPVRSTSDQPALSEPVLSDALERPGSKLGELLQKIGDAMLKLLRTKFPKLAEALGLEDNNAIKVSKRTVRAIREAGEDGVLEDEEIMTIARLVRADPALNRGTIENQISLILDLLKFETSITNIGGTQRSILSAALSQGQVPDANTSDIDPPAVSDKEGDTPPRLTDDLLYRIPTLEERRAQTEELLNSNAMEQVNLAIDQLNLSETERSSLVIEVQEGLIVETDPPFYQGSVSFSFVPDTPEDTAGEERSRIGSVVGWEYQGVRRQSDGSNILALSLESSVSLPDEFRGLPPNEAIAEENNRKDTAIRDALLRAIANVKSGNTQPISVAPSFLAEPPLDGDGGEPKEPDINEKVDIAQLESLLKLFLQRAIRNGKENERALVRNAIFIDRLQDGRCTVHVDRSLITGRVVLKAEQVLNDALLFPNLNAASNMRTSTAMTVEELEAFVSNLEVRLGQQEAPPVLGGDFEPPEEAPSYMPNMTNKGRKIENLRDAARFYTITPPLEGDYKTAAYGQFRDGKWTREEPTYTPYAFTAPDNLRDIHTISGKAKGSVAVPLPIGYRLQTGSLRTTPSTPVRISEDQHGIAHLQFDSESAVTYSVDFGQDPEYKLTREPTPEEQGDMVNANALGTDTQGEVARVRSMENVSNTQKAREFLHYIKDNFYYSTDDKVSEYILAEGGKNYVERVDSHDPRMADCDVANTYFVALCREAGIPARLSVGYSADTDGERSILGPVNGHGWAEVWDGSQWVKFDATPDKTLDTGNAPNPKAPEKDPALLAGDVDLGSSEYEDLIRLFEQMNQKEGVVGNFDSVSQPQMERGELSMWYHNSKVRVRNGGKFFTVAKVDTYKDDGSGNLVYEKSVYFATNVYHTPENLRAGPSLAQAQQSAQKKARSSGYRSVRFTV